LILVFSLEGLFNFNALKIKMILLNSNLWRYIMREKIDEEVSVVMYYSARKRVALPHLISWHDHEYEVGEIGYHHKISNGKVLHHIFEIVDKTNSLWLRLNFNTDNLHWTLEAVSDGNAN
jgi:hypothetical protein